MADRRNFHYLCANGHEMLAEVAHAHCLMVVRGSPCKGELRRIGKGSRKETNGRR